MSKDVKYIKKAIGTIENMYHDLELNFYKYIPADYIRDELRDLKRKANINLDKLEDILFAKNGIKEGILRDVFEALYIMM